MFWNFWNGMYYNNYHNYDYKPTNYKSFKQKMLFMDYVDSAE